METQIVLDEDLYYKIIAGLFNELMSCSFVALAGLLGVEWGWGFFHGCMLCNCLLSCLMLVDKTPQTCVVSKETNVNVNMNIYIYINLFIQIYIYMFTYICKCISILMCWQNFGQQHRQRRRAGHPFPSICITCASKFWADTNHFYWLIWHSWPICMNFYGPVW